MTAGELITKLAEHNPDLPVLLIVEDEYGGGVAAEVFLVRRAVLAEGTFLELTA